MGDSWTAGKDAGERSQLVQALTTAMHEAVRLRMYKLATELRDRTLPLAHDEVADAVRSLLPEDKP
jgi:hypothetical protein